MSGANYYRFAERAELPSDGSCSRTSRQLLSRIVYRLIRRSAECYEIRVDQHIVLGVLVTGDGIPIAHHVFAGNTADVSTVPGVLDDLRGRFGVGRICVVADDGLSPRRTSKNSKTMGSIMCWRPVGAESAFEAMTCGNAVVWVMPSAGCEDERVARFYRLVRLVIDLLVALRVVSGSAGRMRGGVDRLG